jgi:hypothetical protein
MPIEAISEEERLKRAVASLRRFIRDKKELNRLLLGNFESSDEELGECIMFALMDWNTSSPPIAGVSLRDHPAKQLLIEGAAIRSLRSSGIWHTRNQMPGSDGGTSGDDHDKFAQYSGWISQLEADYERKRYEVKEQINVANALQDMGLPSEYSYSRQYINMTNW